MAPTIITHTDVGFPINNGASKSGTGVVWGIYEVTSTEDDDWTILQDFDEILFVDCNSILTGALAAEPVTVATTSTATNKLLFTGGSADTIRVLVAGTRGN